MNRNTSFFQKTLLIANLLLLMTAFTLNAQRRLTDFYSTDLSTEFTTNFIEFNGKAYFMATDAMHGRNLWISDGTKNGTRFFLETEPNRPEINATYFFKTDSILYVFSQQNLWQIDKKQNIKQLNQQPLIISRKFDYFDNKLFFNAIEYYDLKRKSFQKIAINDPQALIDINLRYYSECSQSKIRAFSFYGNSNDKGNKFYVLEPNQTAYTALTLGITFASGVPNKIYKLKGNYFGLVSQRFIVKFSPDKDPENINSFNGSVIYQIQTEEKLYFITTNGSEVYQYVFDGEKLEQTSVRSYGWTGINNLTPISNDSLFYSAVRYANNEAKLQLVQLEKSSELTIKLTLPSDVPVYGSIVKVLNDSLVSFGTQLNDYELLKKTAIVNIKKLTTELIDLGETVLLSNGNFIGSKLKNASQKNSLSLFNLTKREFLIERLPTKSRPKSLGMAVDILNKTLFVGVNEYDNVKSIYAFKPGFDQGKRILAQKDSTFNVRNRINYDGGNVIIDDIVLYNSSSEKNVSNLGEYSFSDNYAISLKYYTYDHLKDTTFQVKNNSVRYGLQNRTFEIDDDKIREVNSTYGNTLKTYYFPIKFRKDINRVVQIDNMIYFWGAEGGEFEDQLFVFDGTDSSFKRIVEQPVYFVHSFKNRPLVLLKTGQLRLLDTKNAFESFFVMDVEFDETKPFYYSNFGNFFIVNSQNRVYYSDGDCQNSGLVDVPQRDGYWGGGKLQNSEYYTLSNQSERFICKGRNTKPFPQDAYDIIGLSNKNVYYLVGIKNEVKGYYDKSVIYQYNLAVSKIMLIDTVDGYGYYGDKYRVIEKGKKWEFILANKLYTITDIGKNADKIEISQLANINGYSTILSTTNNNTLLISNRDLILRNNDKNTTLITLQSDEYWQTIYISYYSLQSEEYIYLPIGSNGFVKKIIRVNIKDFTIKVIEMPFGLVQRRSTFDSGNYYPIALVSERLYGIIESPNEGRQLWLLDEAKQTQKVPVYTSQSEVIKEFVGNKDCTTARLNQLIPTEKVGRYGIFPNPTSKYLFLNLPKDQRQSIEQIEIYDSIGRLISNQLTQNSFAINPDLISLNLPDLATGVYFLKVNLSSTSLNFKFVVE